MLLLNFNLLATAPGGVARLRELILTLAVQGKLVPQAPSDEPASVLLKKIRVEKERLIAEGKIKREKDEPTLTDDDTPFALPDTWTWVALGEVIDIVRGITFPATQKTREPAPGRIACLRTTNVQHTIEWDDLLFVDRSFMGRENQLIRHHDIVMSMANSRELVGKVALIEHIPHPESTFGGFLGVLRPRKIDPRYAMAVLRTPYARVMLIDSSSQTTNIANVSLAKLWPLPFPLPPPAEQSRIVTCVEELMRVCDALEVKGRLEAAQHAQLVSTLLGTLTDSDTPEALAQNWQRIAAHFDLLLDRPEAIYAFEQTILQLAVRGLLVPQDQLDEPASELLKKICIEKDKLIAEGKIKRDKPLPPIAEDAQPFALPQGWEWSTLAAIGIINPRNKAEDDVTASFVPMSSIPVGFLASHITESRPWRDIKSGFTQFAEGDVGVAKITPCFENGKSTVFQNLSNGIGAGTTELHIVRPLCRIVPKYVLLFLKTPSFLIEGEAMMTGSAGQKRMPRNYLEKKPFPLPPLDEQARIVTRVEELHHLCIDLRQRLTGKQTTQAHLAEALVESVAG